MTDFIPGEAYRLDIVGADDSVIIDSWANKVKASVVATDGTLQVDVDSGRIYGPMIGDILDIDGTVVYDATLKKLTADVVGDILDTEGNTILDVSLGIFNGNVQGDVIDTNGITMVDAVNKTIDAEAIYGTFYGDLIGNVTTENTMFGTFSGDFNGSHYGEFYGDITGNVVGELTGDVVGNVTGNVTGNVIGDIMADADTSLMSPPNEQHNQWNWLGGINHTVQPADDAIARGPIVVLGDTRDESALRGHVQHYDGRNVVQLDVLGGSPWPAHFHGKLRGEVYTSDDNAVLTYNENNGQVILKSYGILSLEADNGTGALNFVGDTATFNVRGPQTVRSFNGTWDNKSALLPDDCLLQFDAEGFDGTGWKQGGGFGIYLEDEPIGDVYKTIFGIALPNGVVGPAGNESKALIFDSAGTLRIPTLNLGSTTFAERDSMTPQEGTIVFNTSNKKFQGYNGTDWVDLG